MRRLILAGLLPYLAAGVCRATADTERRLQICAVCHESGAGGAPRIGRVADWAPRLKSGMPALIGSVKHGVPGTLMPGGSCRDCSDAQIEELILRMSADSHNHSPLGNN